jgi:glutamate synthase (NADPH/NADH) large chain
MVDLDPLDEADTDELHGILTRHGQETESALVGVLLGDWPSSRGRFTKVMPKDYKRVMQLTAQAIEQGIDPMVLVMGGGRG